MKNFITKILTLILVCGIGFNFVGCKEDPETPEESQPSTTQSVAVQENTTYIFYNSSNDKLRIKMLADGTAIFLDENETVFAGAFVNENGVFTVTVSEGNCSIESTNDFEEILLTPISQTDTEKHIFIIEGTENSVQITESQAIASEKKIETTTTLEIENDSINIDNGLYDAKYYYNQSNNTWSQSPVSGDTCIYIESNEGLYSANGFVTEIQTYSLGNVPLVKIQQATEIMWSIPKIEKINNIDYWTMFGAAFEKTESTMEFALTEDLTLTANCCYNIDYDQEITTKITKDKQNQDLAFSILLKQNGDVQFIGPKGIVQTGKWIVGISNIIIKLDNNGITSSINYFELVSLNQYGEPMLNAIQEDIIENATSMFVVGAVEFFVIAWTDSSRTYFDDLAQ